LEKKKAANIKAFKRRNICFLSENTQAETKGRYSRARSVSVHVRLLRGKFNDIEKQPVGRRKPSSRPVL